MEGRMKGRMDGRKEGWKEGRNDGTKEGRLTLLITSYLGTAFYNMLLTER
jgi:hypothetical protein